VIGTAHRRVDTNEPGNPGYASQDTKAPRSADTCGEKFSKREKLSKEALTEPA
jgi:hypothetical protein